MENATTMTKMQPGPSVTVLKLQKNVKRLFSVLLPSNLSQWLSKPTNWDSRHTKLECSQDCVDTNLTTEFWQWDTVRRMERNTSRLRTHGDQVGESMDTSFWPRREMETDNVVSTWPPPSLLLERLDYYPFITITSKILLILLLY